MNRYEASQTTLERALEVIPVGAQTYSKSPTHYPRGVSPHFAERADGCRLWDVDGREYLDFVSALCAVTLGYGHEAVEAAVRDQLDDGVSASLSMPIEVEVAEQLVDAIPCADMARFGKNGSDATTGAVRVARAHTGRDRVAACGYHGWHDWYIGTTARNAGIPSSAGELTHRFDYNDLESLERILETHSGEVAAVIMEPMNSTHPDEGFLEGVRQLTDDHGAVLIFDEMISGFRFDTGGAQSLFGVTPDLATFGKGMANGFPLSAVAGRQELMREFEDVYFSFTFGGEALSLAAASAVLSTMSSEPVTDRLADVGRYLLDGVDARIEDHGVEDYLSTAGHPTWSFLRFDPPDDYHPYDLKTLFCQEVFRRGVLTLGTHNLNDAHDRDTVDRLLEVYDEVFPILGDAVRTRTVHDRLDCEPIRPIFEIR